MKTFFIILILLFATLPTFAQERNYFHELQFSGVMQSDGTWHYWRFDTFPVTVGGYCPNAEWCNALAQVTAEINQVVPLVSVPHNEADIVITYSQYNEAELAGSGTLTIDASANRLRGVVILDLPEIYHACEVLLHEVLHALGMPHSSDPNDIMFQGVHRDSCSMSERDANTLQMLYSSPAVTMTEWQSHEYAINEFEAQLVSWCQRPVAHTLSDEAYQRYCGVN